MEQITKPAEEATTTTTQDGEAGAVQPNRSSFLNNIFADDVQGLLNQEPEVIKDRVVAAMKAKIQGERVALTEKVLERLNQIQVEINKIKPDGSPEVVKADGTRIRPDTYTASTWSSLVKLKERQGLLNAALGKAMNSGEKDVWAKLAEALAKSGQPGGEQKEQHQPK